MSTPKPMINQLLDNSASACPVGYQPELEAAIASADLSRMADFAEEIVQETCPRQLWVLVAHLMYRSSQNPQNKGAAHG
jgi:hypothetical protein